MKLRNRKLPNVRINVPCGEAVVCFETDSKASVRMGRDPISDLKIKPTIIDFRSYLVRCVMERSGDNWRAMEIRIQNAEDAKGVADKNIRDTVVKQLNEAVTRWLSLENRDLKIKLIYAENQLKIRLEEQSKVEKRQSELAAEIDVLKKRYQRFLSQSMGMCGSHPRMLIL